MKNLIFCLLIFFGFYPISKKRSFLITGFAQGTSYQITYFAKDSLISKSEITKIFNQIDSSLSIYKSYSLINRFNESFDGVNTDIHLKNVVKKAVDIFKETKGEFDITVYPLVNAWGFGITKINTLPDSNSIAKLLPCVGSNKILLKNNRLLKTRPCVKIDVNGIAQGYTVDVIAEFLEQKGIKNYLVELGGELRVKGKKPDGSLMKIGIEMPAQNKFDDIVTQKMISIKDGAITTSGNYRKYVTVNGVKLSHLINPQTGYPIKSQMISVTVIAKKGIDADGYDNPLMAMNIEDALLFVNSRKDLEAYFIYRKANGTIVDTASIGFYKYFIN